MSILDTLRMAIQAIARNKMRSFLTSLGIIIGVASVVAMVHLGQSATRSVTDQIASMGSNLLFVMPGTRLRSRGVRSSASPFDQKTVDALDNEISGIVVAPTVSKNTTVVYGNANDTMAVVGATNAYFEVPNQPLDYRRLFQEKELISGAAVCVIGKTVVDELYVNDEPLGTTLRIEGTACRVIGVLEERGESMGQDRDKTVVMPLKAVQRRLVGTTDIQTVYVSAVVDGSTRQKQSEIEALLRQRRRIGPGEDDDFFVRNMQDISDALEGTTTVLTTLLGAIAAISLLVGGIGIMNIMLVSVTERTREIGIRLAVGARARDVLVQFLVESIMLSTLGGLIGLGLGVGGTYVATQKLDLPFVLSPATMLLGFSFSVVIGVVFGYVPARKAAHLNPIDALRHE